MHELSICQGLISAIEDAARHHEFSRVTVVTVEVGRFAGVEIEALRFSFDVARVGTVCAGARLDIIDLPGSGWCFTCGETVPLADRLAPCPKCGGGRLQANGGDDLKIRDLEVI